MTLINKKTSCFNCDNGTMHVSHVIEGCFSYYVQSCVSCHATTRTLLNGLGAGLKEYITDKKHWVFGE